MLARDVLERIATIVKPKTLLDWDRRLVERRAASPRRLQRRLDLAPAAPDSMSC